MGFNLQATLTANTSQFHGALNAASAKARGVMQSIQSGGGKLGAAMGQLGIPTGAAAAGVALGKALYDAWNNADKFVTMGARFGTSADFMRRVSFAAAQSGTDLEAATGAMGKLAKAASQAGDSEKIAGAFASLGISLDQIEGKSPAELFLMVGRALKGAGGDSEATAAAMMLMGKSAAQLLPMFEDIDGALAGAPVSPFFEFFSEQIEELGDNFGAIWQSITEIAGAALGTIAFIINGILDSVRWVGAFLGSMAGGEGPIDAARAATAQIVNEKLAKQERRKKKGGLLAGDEDDDGDEKGGASKKKKAAEKKAADIARIRREAKGDDSLLAGDSRLGILSGNSALFGADLADKKAEAQRQINALETTAEAAKRIADNTAGLKP